jgi:hypothetical protein
MRLRKYKAVPPLPHTPSWHTFTFRIRLPLNLFLYAFPIDCNRLNLPYNREQESVLAGNVAGTRLCGCWQRQETSMHASLGVWRPYQKETPSGSSELWPWLPKHYMLLSWLSPYRNKSIGVTVLAIASAWGIVVRMLEKINAKPAEPCTCATIRMQCTAH